MSNGWRLRARDRIREVIAENPHLRSNPKAMLKAIDESYPFGMRKYTPYKEWLAERAKAVDELATEPIHRICKVCGAKPFKLCRDLETLQPIAELHGYRLDKGGPNGPLFGEA